MRLEPVFVLAPKPKPPSMPTRRAFFVAAATGAIGTAAGFAAGWGWRGAAPAPGTAGPSEELLLRLQWAGSLAANSTGNQLLAELPAFIAVLHEAIAVGVDDEVLWNGARAAAEAVLADERAPDRVLHARALCTLLDVDAHRRLEGLRGALLRAARR